MRWEEIVIEEVNPLPFLNSPAVFSYLLIERRGDLEVYKITTTVIIIKYVAMDAKSRLLYQSSAVVIFPP